MPELTFPSVRYLFHCVQLCILDPRERATKQILFIKIAVKIDELIEQ